MSAAPWYRSATNPPCARWCTRPHGADEFSELGDLRCVSDALSADEDLSFRLTQISSVDPDHTPGLVERHSLRLEGPNLDDLDDHRPTALRRYAQALLNAADALEGTL